MAQAFQIKIHVEERAGLDRRRERVRLGVPLPKGLLREPGRIAAVNGAGESLAMQGRPLGWWPDGTIKWLLVDVLVELVAHGRAELLLVPAERGEAHAPYAPSLGIEAHGAGFIVDTGLVTFEAFAGADSLLGPVRAGGRSLLAPSGAKIRLVGSSGREYTAVPERVRVEEHGPLCGSIVAEGAFCAAGRRSPLLFKARLNFVAGMAALWLDFQVRNPRAARHPGGLWDLGDRGTLLFEDLSLQLSPAEPVRKLRWYAESSDRAREESPLAWSLHQDSSGGENWDSDNHVNPAGDASVAFRGYRVKCAHPDGLLASDVLIAEGDRATPCVSAITDQGSVGATVLDFWQNFPKALRWDREHLSVGLFPAECRTAHALQGGEQKRQTVVLEFLASGVPTSIPALQHPLIAWVDPAWVEGSKAVESFIAASRDPHEDYLRYIGAIIEGPHSFVAKREIVDEYGWRHFGDVYADHEAVQHRSPKPLISHYNNQYDLIYGAMVHFLRTGDVRWWQLASEAARHTIDIDIYHTDADKAAFNHGLFWHTDHHKAAETCTHRTYSRRNGTGRAYGGGPSSEHNYTSGLLLYFYVSGDPEAADAVRELASWVVAMDDGSRSILGLLDSGPTGLASRTVDDWYHKPGRGAGNSINALLDAYQLSGERRFADKAEELIRRCIHPSDDLAALGLSEPETRWSYLVFLQVLGKFLHSKLEWREIDYAFHHARASLLHYAGWIVAHEVPYKDVLHKVALPTETWPAQDIRKCHVLNLAAEFSRPEDRTLLAERARFFFKRSLEDVLSFETAFLTRPLVILSVYGHVQAYYEARREEGPELEELQYSFGAPQVFSPQKLRWRAQTFARVRSLVGQIARAVAGRVFASRWSTPSRL